MRHEKVIPNELNDSLVKIEVEAQMVFDNKIEYEFEVSVRIKGPKAWRNWAPAVDLSSKEYRKLGLSERREYANKVISGLVTEKEILEAKMELWNKMKPE